MKTQIERIFKSYDRELLDYYNQPEEGKLSGIWKHCDKEYIFGGKVNRKELKEKLKDFPINELGRGLSIYGEPSDKLILIIEEWIKETNLPITILSYPEQFGFNGFYVGDMFIMSQAPRLSYSSQIVSNISKGDVVEIGGGFGGIAYHLFKDFNFNKTYINFDIPYVSLVAKYFLTTVFPEKRFMFYGEDKIENYNKYDIVILPYYEFSKMPNFDTVVNFNSLPEMGSYQVKEYLKLIDKKAKHFFHINHDIKATRFGDSIEDVYDLSKEGWQLPKKRWKQLSRKLSKFSDFNDNLEYYEYIYEKTTNNKR